MATDLRSDPTFYPSPRAAVEAPVETIAYVVSFDREARSPDGLLTVDVDPSSPTYGEVVGRVDLGIGDELHHFGWNACSSALCHKGHQHGMERRYLLVPGLRSSRIHVLDTKADPRHPRLVRTIEPEEIASRTGYSRPHTIHCGPDGIYVSALGNPEGKAPGGVFIIDHDTFEVKGRFELDRGPQELAYDFWWHLGYDTAVTSEWGTPQQVESGVLPDVLLAGGYGHQLHIWDLPGRRHKQVIDLGGEQQMVLELRPAHDPTRAYGFVGVVVSLADLSASVWRWSLEGDRWGARKVIEIPAEPAEAEQLPPLLAGFKAVPPIITDINLSVDDRWLYVSSWATGEISRYDVSDPEHPRRTAAVHLGGVVRRAPHPKAPDRPLAGGPQMVEVSRDGKRVYLTNSLYGAWDDQFYPDGVGSWMVKLDADDDGGLTLDERFLVTSEQRLHQVHLEGGDASSDSYCES
ncbi:MAG TPA: selenium-binding protein SBP56-related protein [Candidatus Dormibacteraeota bacterium]|jgi:selenium-binding protein 1|nr:selenium-binding protein SBP56-related protein [Candidatus Dormibacteraeota bacterium]